MLRVIIIILSFFIVKNEKIILTILFTILSIVSIYYRT